MIAIWKAEWHKHNVWILACLVGGTSVGIVGLKTLGFLLRQSNLEANNRFHWAVFIQAGHVEWAQMLVPLTIATWAAYVCWVETEANAWKLLLMQPRGRQATFFGKLLLLCLTLLAFFALNAGALILAGSFLFPDQDIPLRQILMFHGLGTFFFAPLLMVQAALSLRFHHPIGPLAFCMMGNILAIFSSGTWTKLLPWHYAQYLGAIDPQEHLSTLAMVIGLSIGWMLLAYGDFMRKDIP